MPISHQPMDGTISSELTSKAFGWVVEVSRPAPHAALQFNVAEPDKGQAVEAVRRRIPEAATAKVEGRMTSTTHPQTLLVSSEEMVCTSVGWWLPRIGILDQYIGARGASATPYAS